LDLANQEGWNNSTTKNMISIEASVWAMQSEPFQPSMQQIWSCNIANHKWMVVSPPQNEATTMNHG
jgi:hypothetical protein